jgi:hypothetical protein
MIEGQCLCGAVRLSVAAHEIEVGACHCRLCQQWTGGVFLSFGGEAAGVRVAGPVVRYKSSEFAERAFCGNCGSHLWMRDAGSQDAEYDLAPGLFEAAKGFGLRSESYADRALACIRFAGDHRRETRAEYEAKHKHVEGEPG